MAKPGYDAFISYSHAADLRLAPALQRALQRFARPWWKLRALTLFRDETSLAAASSLGGALLQALDTARFFIFLASPRAAASRWCNEEVAHWLRHRSSDTLLIVLTEGTVVWDEPVGDFDWSGTDALPPALKGALTAEPLWLDLSWVRQSEQLSERDPRFQQVVAKLAATLHGRSLEDISGEDVRQHRRTRLVATGAMAAIVTLAIGAGVSAWEATRARDEAERQRGVAETSAAEAERQRAAARTSEQEARAQRDAAQRALAQTLDAADTLVLEIADGMKDFAGVPRARLRRVLERAEKILDALPVDTDSPAIQRRRIQMSRVFSDAMMVLGDTQQALRRATTATEIARRQSDLKPGDIDRQRDLASSLINLGDVQLAQGELASAQRSYEESRAIRERPARGDLDEASWQRELSVSLERVGDVQVARGDLAGALRSYETGRAILERLAGSEAGNATRQRDLASSLIKVGDVQQAQGDLAAALRSFEASLAIYGRLARSDAGNASWQHDVSKSLDRVGNVRLAQGDPAGALRSYEESRAIRERLTSSDAGNTEWQRGLAVSLNKSGDAQSAQRDLVGALRSYEASRDVLERLAKSDAGNARWQRDLSVSWHKVGDVQKALDDLAGALRSFEASRAIAERLAKSDAANAGWQRDLSVSLDKVGVVQAAQGDLAGALRSFDESRAIRERLASSDPGNAGWQYDVFISLWQVALMKERMPGRLAEARDTWRRAVELITDLAATRRLQPVHVRFVELAKARLALAEERLASHER